MANMDGIRPLVGVTDHGFGLLGGLAHSVLADFAQVPLPAPRLHLGQNTLPHPPAPLPARVPFGDLSKGWADCGGDLAAFLAAGALTLRDQPTPSPLAYSPRVRALQAVLRFDSIAMVWRADCDQDVGTPAIVTWAADRAGHALLGWIPSAGTVADIELTENLLTADDQLIVVLLREVLLAQCAWTAAVFGLGPVG
jgi:hypothetical protein